MFQNDSGTEMSVSESRVDDNRPSSKVAAVVEPANISRQTDDSATNEPGWPLRPGPTAAWQSHSTTQPVSIAELIQYEYQQLVTPVDMTTTDS